MIELFSRHSLDEVNWQLWQSYFRNARVAAIADDLASVVDYADDDTSIEKKIEEKE